MRPPSTIVLRTIAAVPLLLPLCLAAFSDGPMPNMTGGFGDSTCHTCHFDNPLSAPGTTLVLSGIPAAYIAARTYAITVTLQRRDMRRGGFEIAARFLSGSDRGRQAGTWRALDDRVQIRPSAGRLLQFPQHTKAGTVAAMPGRLTWKVEWTAPRRPSAPVQFNVAANASNDDASPLGDYICVQQTRSVPR